MAKGKGEVCILCQQDPCGCLKATKRTVPRQRTPKSKPVKIIEVPENPTLKPSAISAMKAAADAAKLKEMHSPDRRVASHFDSMNEEYALTLSAIRTLLIQFDIDDGDLAPFREHLDHPPTIAERSAAWRARRRLRGGDTPQ